MRRAARQEERERTDAAVVIFAEAVDFVHCLVKTPLRSPVSQVRGAHLTVTRRC